MQISFLISYDFITGSGDKQLQYTRKEIFIIVKEHLKDGLTAIIGHLEGKISEKSLSSVHVREDMKASFSALFHRMRSTWQKANRTEETFFQKYEELLNAPVFFPVPATSQKARPIKAVALPRSLRLAEKGQNEVRPKKFVQRCPRTSWHMLLK
jgi:hypothetical protein